VPIFSYSSITLLLKPSILECQTYCEHDENYYLMLQVKQKQVEISHLRHQVTLPHAGALGSLIMIKDNSLYQTVTLAAVI